MAVTGSITTRFIDEKGVDLGKTLIEKDYLISVYPNIVNQLDTPRLLAWGVNNYGSVGDNTTTQKNSPVDTVAYGANWKQVSCRGWSTLAVKTDGTLWAWGYNAYGNLGDNTVSNRSSPVQTVAFGTNWKQVSNNFLHSSCIKTDGTLWSWGINYGSGAFGTLGDNTLTARRSSPVQTVAFGTNWKQVSCGYSGFTMAVKTDGTLWGWGTNSNGQLGNNTTSHRSSPVQTVAFGTNWVQVSCGRNHSAAIKNDNTLWCWGVNNLGQLGDNTNTRRSSPVQTVAGGNNWKQVSCGTDFMAAVKTDGTLWCWGANATNGTLGDNTTTPKSSPIQTIAYGTNWKQVFSGDKITAALKTDGTLWLWGYGFTGLLGDNTNTAKSSPVQTILFGQTWKQVSTGSLQTAAIKDGDF